MIQKFFLLILCYCSLVAYSENLETPQKFLYSTKVFTGHDYTEMNPVKGQRIFLFADRPNFIQLSFLTENDNTFDINGFSQIFLEIRKDGSFIKQIPLENILIYNQVDKKSNNWKVFRGMEADIESAFIDGIKKRYNEAYKKYLVEYKNINKLKKELLKKIKKLSLAGISTLQLSKDYNALKLPEQPPKPPIENRTRLQAYYINLPEGEYLVVAKPNNKDVFEESRCQLIMISARRKNIVGYQIIPGNIWSPPLNLKTIKQILYTNGKTNLYMTPYFQNEYNDYHFSQIMAKDQDGNPSQFTLSKTSEILNLQAEIISSRQTQVVFEQRFNLEKNPNFLKGGHPYNFISSRRKGNMDFLRAFYIPLDETPSYIKIRLQNSEGKYLQSSTREIRIVDSDQFPVILYVIIFIPIIIMLILQVRGKRYK